VTFDVDQFGQPLRLFRPQRVVAWLTGLAAGTVQLGWLNVAQTKNILSWPADAGLLVAATAYLICLARFHASTARWRPGMLAPRLWRLGLGMTYDLSICALAVVSLVRGPQSGVLLLGLWLIPPTLLAVSVLSAIVAALAWLEGYRWLSVDIPPPAAPLANPQRDWPRLVSWLLLFVLLLATELAEPALRGAGLSRSEPNRSVTSR
jgi:hypothetical protein